MDAKIGNLTHDALALTELAQGYFSSPGERVMSENEQLGLYLLLEQVRTRLVQIEEFTGS